MIEISSANPRIVPILLASSSLRVVRTSFKTAQTRLMGSVFSADPKPGGAITETEENSASARTGHTSIMSETKGRNPSTSNTLRFLAPAQEIRTWEDSYLSLQKFK